MKRSLSLLFIGAILAGINYKICIAQEPTKQVTSLEVKENSKEFSKIINNDDASRYLSIKIDSKIASDEVNFWAHQLAEHAMILELGLEHRQLYEEASRLYNNFTKFRNEFVRKPYNLEIMNRILPLAKLQREFEVKVFNLLEAGQWVGWIFPTYLNHTIMELDYFVDKLNGVSFTPQQELEFWNRINREHAGLTQKFLDPQETKLAKKAGKLSNPLILPKDELGLMIKLSLGRAKELDTFNKDAKRNSKAVRSIIHPVLLDHMIREGERSVAMVSKLQNQLNSKLAFEYR